MYPRTVSLGKSFNNAIKMSHKKQPASERLLEDLMRKARELLKEGKKK